MKESKPKKQKKKSNKSNMPEGLRKSAVPFLIIMALPAVYGIIRYFVTNGYSILLAFSDGTPFVAPFTLRNFKMFWADMQGNGILKLSLMNTLKYFVVGLIQQFICYVVAYFLYKKIPKYKVFRFLFYMPCLIPAVVTSAIFMELIRVGGPIYRIMDGVFGIQYNELLSRPETATTTMIVFMFLSGIGTTYLIYMGAMNRIPVEILESAKLDGCSAWREFWSLIFPLTFGTYATFFLMSLCGIFTASGPILYMTQGAADTSTLGWWLFSQVIDGSYNYPAAVGVIFTLLGIPILFVSRWAVNKITPEVTY